LKAIDYAKNNRYLKNTYAIEELDNLSKWGKKTNLFIVIFVYVLLLVLFVWIIRLISRYWDKETTKFVLCSFSTFAIMGLLFYLFRASYVYFDLSGVLTASSLTLGLMLMISKLAGWKNVKKFILHCFLILVIGTLTYMSYIIYVIIHTLMGF